MPGVKGKSGVYKRTKIQIERIAKSNRGKHRSILQKNNIANALKGRHLSNEHRENLKKAKLGKPQPNIGKALKGKKLSKETRLKLSKATSGNKHPNWQGGTPITINKNYTNYRWKQLRLKILDRDKYTCFICHTKFESKELIIHHKIKYKLCYNNLEENLITVCRKCHMTKDNKLHL